MPTVCGAYRSIAVASGFKNVLPSVETSAHWTEVLALAQRHRENGDLPLAIAIASEAVEVNAQDPDARGWSLYHLFRFLKESGRECEAVGLTVEILSANSNLPSKLFVTSVSLDVCRRRGNTQLAEQIGQMLDESLTRWLTQPASLDDIDMPLAVQVVKQVSALPCASLFKNLVFANFRNDDKVVASLAQALGERPRPRVFNELPDRVASYMHNIGAPGVFQFRVADNVVLRRCGKFVYLFDSSGNLLPVIYADIPLFYKYALEHIARSDLNKTSNLRGTALCILDQYNQAINFCHWIADYIPRVLAASDIGIDFQAVIGPFKLNHDFQLQSAAKSFKGCEYIDVESSGAIHVERLIYADNFGGNLRHPAFDCHPRLIKLLRESLGMFISPDNAEPIKIYVPRSHSRRVRNDAELWALLKAHGFVRIDTDALSFRDQIGAFSRASHVIGPHGAALTNIIFSRSGTKFLELYPRFGGSAAFFALAAAVKVEYSCFIDVSDGWESNDEIDVFVNDVDMTVDLGFVASWINGD